MLVYSENYIKHIMPCADTTQKSWLSQMKVHKLIAVLYVVKCQNTMKRQKLLMHVNYHYSFYISIYVWIRKLLSCVEFRSFTNTVSFMATNIELFRDSHQLLYGNPFSDAINEYWWKKPRGRPRHSEAITLKLH